MKKRGNKIKQFIKRLIKEILVLIGILFLLNVAVEKVKTIDINQFKKVVINFDNPASEVLAKADAYVVAESEEIQAPVISQPEISLGEIKADSFHKSGEFSAYTASEAETDSDPKTMASGKEVYEGAIANNCLPFGTKIKVNGKVKVVEDRMNSRYDCDNFDIYFTDYNQAVEFGRKTMDYELIN